MRTPLRLLAGILDFCIPPHCPLCGARLPLGGGPFAIRAWPRSSGSSLPGAPSAEGPSPPRRPCPIPRGTFAPTAGTFSPSSTGHAPSGPCGTSCGNWSTCSNSRAKPASPRNWGRFWGASPARRCRTRSRSAHGSPTFPSIPLRWRERGYDQAQLLALAVAESLGLQHVEVLARRRDTPVQFRLPAARRRSNVRGAFAVVRPQAVEGKRLLLIDDVITTGSTVSACAEALKKAGAASVDVLAVCHTGAGFSYES